MLDSHALSLTFIIRNKEEEQENLSFLGGKTLVLLSALPQILAMHPPGPAGTSLALCFLLFPNIQWEDQG